jgi:hypothetical protein
MRHARAQKLSSVPRILHPGGKTPLQRVSAGQPGRMSGSGARVGIFAPGNACAFGRLPPRWDATMTGRIATGEKVLLEKAVSRSGGASFRCSMTERPAFSPMSAAEVRLPTNPPVGPSGMGWTKAKHASAMIVTTVAQLLTKLRLISIAFPMQSWRQLGLANIAPLFCPKRAVLRYAA